MSDLSMLIESAERFQSGRPSLLDNLRRSPEDLTPEARYKTLKLIFEIAEMRTEPPELDSEFAQAFRGPAAAWGLDPAQFPLPELPDEQNTRPRRVHDIVHSMLLNSTPQLLVFQHMVDELLRKNGVWAPLDLLTLLNLISQDLTGKQRFLELVNFSATRAQVVEALDTLHREKPEMHLELLGTLIRAATFERAPHARACNCILCTHMTRALGKGKGKGKKGKGK